MEKVSTYQYALERATQICKVYRLDINTKHQLRNVRTHEMTPCFPLMTLGTSYLFRWIYSWIASLMLIFRLFVYCRQWEGVGKWQNFAQETFGDEIENERNFFIALTSITWFLFFSIMWRAMFFNCFQVHSFMQDWSYHVTRHLPWTSFSTQL